MTLRTIKFRWQRIDTKEWVYGWLVGDKRTLIIGCHLLIDTFTSRGKTISPKSSDIWEVTPETVCQHIEHKDKVGTEIYFWDLVLDDNGWVNQIYWDDYRQKIYFANIDEEEYSFELEWEDREYGMVYSSTKQLKVVGNKFDNPDMASMDLFFDENGDYEPVKKLKELGII